MTLQLLDLLTKGYFPKELPPPFITANFAQLVAGPSASLPADASSSRPKHSVPCVHNLVRAGGLRRNLTIPNPKHFVRLAEAVVSNWMELERRANDSPFSLSKPVYGRSNRSISPEHDLGGRVVSRAELRSTSRFVLKTDISRFYPSIYTHSIPWALMGKTSAKAAHASRSLEGT